MQAFAIPSLCVLPCAHSFSKLRTQFSEVNTSWVIFAVTNINPKFIPMVTTNALKKKTSLSVLPCLQAVYCPMPNMKDLLFFCI